MDTASRPQLLQTPDVIINPFVFAAPSSGLSISPDHWWDLSDDGAWNDSVGTWDFVENGSVTVSAGAGPNGQDVAVFDASNDRLYVSATKNPTTEGFTAATSISYWANFDSFNTGSFGNYCFSWRDNAGSYHFDSGYTGSADDAFAFRGPTLAVQSKAAAVSEATGTWYHIAGVWDGSTQVLYVNGTAYDSKTNTNSVINTSVLVLFGQAAAGVTATQFLGKAGMVGLWAGALTAADITYLYNSGDGRQFADL